MKLKWLVIAGLFLFAPAAWAQRPAYIGYVYPAGGQQGTTFQVKLGGQGLEEITEALVTGSGVAAKVLEYDRPLNNQETTLLSEQLKELKRSATNTAATMMDVTMMAAESAMMTAEMASAQGSNLDKPESLTNLIARIEKRIGETVVRPASAALAGIVYVQVTIAPDAPPGQRELRLRTLRGLSNPLVFCVGQFPEVSRKPMVTASLQVLGKEEQALRKRPADEVEQRIPVPCTLNGQIASGELNRYRFTARQGQHLVITTQARQLIPFIADAVPGWFQPVLALYDAEGKEVAYDDDYRFKPDPTILYDVPKDGEYLLAIYDAIYRGREDFVYRISLGELPFVTSIFPLGSRTNTPVSIQMKGWNLERAVLTPPAPDAGPGIGSVTATRDGLVSNPLPFALGTLPEILEQEPNDTLARAQKVTLPVIINGHMDRPGDWDVFRFTGKSNQTIVAEVSARRLDSPLDSLLKLTDANGKVLAVNDDCEDLEAGINVEAGINTHLADSYLRVTLPADGAYYVHLGDTARKAGDEYGYRLRLSEPQPDFALRVVPSSVNLRSKSTAVVSVYAIRKDGFTGPIKLGLKELAGFSAMPASLTGTQVVARLTLKTTLASTAEPVNLTVIGTAKIHEHEVTHEAVPAEDRMQAFLWRHLVPASEFKAQVFDPSYQPAPKRVPPVRPPSEVAAKPVVTTTNSTLAATNALAKFTKQQVAGRLRQLKVLYEDGLLTDDFYERKVAECEAAQ